MRDCLPKQSPGRDCSSTSLRGGTWSRSQKSQTVLNHFLQCSRRGGGQSLCLSWEQVVVLCRTGIGNLSQAAGIQTHLTLQRPYLELIHCMYPPETSSAPLSGLYNPKVDECCLIHVLTLGYR